MLRALLTAAILLSVFTAPAAAKPRVVDNFEDISQWEALASEGAEISVDSDDGLKGKALRLDFNFRATGGYVNVKKKIRMKLPENYTFSFYLRGNGPPNNLEFKLLDPTGRNVWWRNDRAVELKDEWVKRDVWASQIRFAWGPNPGPAEQVGYIEFTVKANKGGAGSVWIDELTFEKRPPEATLPWPPKISSSIPGPADALTAVFDGNLETGWHSPPDTPDRQWLVLDLGQTRLYGGLVIDWDPEDYATSFSISLSDELRNWQTDYSVADSHGKRTYVYLPSAASRFIRIDLSASSRGLGYGIREIVVEPYSFSESINSFFTTIARAAPPGAYPKYLSERQTYWTVIGVNGDAREALINEEGMVEVDAQSFSVEPMLYVDGKVITWNDVTATQSLADAYLPIPTVQWQSKDAALPLELQITAAANGKRGESTLYNRYRVTNRGDEAKKIKLYLALRPFQVNPPWQSLDTFTGATPIWSIERSSNTILLRSRANAPIQRVELLDPPSRFGAALFEEGSLYDFVSAGEVPAQSRVEGGLGYATGIIQYELELEPGRSKTVDIAMPWYPASPIERDAGRAIDEATDTWRDTLAGIHIDISPRPDLRRLLLSTVAYILINRDGPGIQPGSRTYARSWIRDGALTSIALLEMGRREEIREFLTWYAGHQFASGRVPCCVDVRGPDPTPEYDSDGELIYTLAEYYRYTGDTDLVRALWVNVVGAADHMIELRQRRMTDEYRKPEKAGYFGILPESISHEGYAAHPAHSYWDDFFALRGFVDAAMLANAIGDTERARKFSEAAASFEDSLSKSIEWAVAVNAISYIHGSVELGDFDPTATAILPTIGLGLPQIDRRLLPMTFERYYRFFRDRADDTIVWTNYAPYEFRNVNAFVHLGDRDRAVEVLDFLTSRRRPDAWNLWPEIVWRDPEAPRFVGDIPHTWAGSSFISALRSMLVYENLADNQLVLAAGVPASWLAEEGVVVRDLPTELGRISYELHRDDDGTVRMDISGDLKDPPAHILVRPPLPTSGVRALVDEAPVSSFDGQNLVIDHLPASIELIVTEEATPQANP